jgi:LCP family protein required for cell wall assembly
VERDRTELDDRSGRPLPPRLDPRAGRPVRTPAGTGRSRAGARTLRLLGATLSVLLLAGSGWGWYLSRVAEASVNRTDAIPTTGNNGVDGASMNLLLVGDDSRTDLTPAQLKQLSAGVDSGVMNTDTMMLLHVPADGSRASFVSFPRDSYVQIPGHGWDKLNAAFADGYTSAPRSSSEQEKQAAGQQLLVQTISQLTGLQIDHFASVDLLGFFNLANVVGGVEVNLCKAVSDSYSGAKFPAGVQTISGADALKFVRQRHGLPRGDLDRVVRQQVFLAGVARKMLSEKVLLDPTKQQQLVKAVAGSLTVDQNLDILSLAQQMQSVTAGAVNFRTMPIVGDAKDPQGRDILQLPTSSTLHQFFAHLSDDAAPATSAAPSTSAAPTTPAVVPSSVQVQVLNGSGTSGLAAKAASALTSAGYRVVGTGNADTSKYTQTQVRYGAGASDAAAALAAAVPGAATSASSAVAAGTVQLVLGSDWSGLGGSSAASSSDSAAAAAADTDPPRTAADTSCIN